VSEGVCRLGWGLVSEWANRHLLAHEAGIHAVRFFSSSFGDFSPVQCSAVQWVSDASTALPHALP
jgi:hypothetical protein